MPMRKLLFSAALLALPTTACADALPGPISYEVNSWGQLLLRWQINPDGSGEIWRGGLGAKHIRKFRLRLDGNALKTFIANAQDARAATRGGIKCQEEMTDMPYGTITWNYPGARQEYHFDAGCRSRAADDAQEILTALSSNVETLAKIDAKPYLVEAVPQH